LKFLFAASRAAITARFLVKNDLPDGAPLIEKLQQKTPAQYTIRLLPNASKTAACDFLMAALRSIAPESKGHIRLRPAESNLQSPIRESSAMRSWIHSSRSFAEVLQVLNQVRDRYGLRIGRILAGSQFQVAAEL
jgi:hypothetical protein